MSFQATACTATSHCNNTSIYATIQKGLWWYVHKSSPDVSSHNCYYLQIFSRDAFYEHEHIPDLSSSSSHVAKREIRFCAAFFYGVITFKMHFAYNSVMRGNKTFIRVARSAHSARNSLRWRLLLSIAYKIYYIEFCIYLHIYDNIYAT